MDVIYLNEYVLSMICFWDDWIYLCWDIVWDEIII